MKVLVTGATGFVGRALLAQLRTQAQFNVRAAVRQPATDRLGGKVTQVLVGDLGGDTDWRAALKGIDAVVHLAARVHIVHEHADDPLLAFRQVNVAGSVHLAQMAAQAGVKRLVYMSSVKVHGEATALGQPFVETSPTQPYGPYGISKLETEQGLQAVAQATGLELTILRPPLVYGPGARANFAALAGAVSRSLPLPLGAIYNRRSLVGVDNLAHLITTCLVHPAAANQAFMASDGEDMSTTHLVQRMAQAMERTAYLLPIPVWMLEAGASMLGQQDATQRLCGNLQVDSNKARSLLGWVPPVSVDEGLRRAVAEYMK